MAGLSICLELAGQESLAKRDSSCHGGSLHRRKPTGVTCEGMEATYGEIVIAFVSLRDGVAPSEQELRDYARPETCSAPL
jgi:hypothetical protein